MKTAFWAVILLLFSAGVDAQSFRTADLKIEQGSLLVMHIDSRWCGPGWPNVSLSFLEKRYLPNKNCDVFVGVDIHTEPGNYVATLVDYATGDRLNWEFITVNVVGTDFPKTRTARYSGRPSERKDRQKNIIDKSFKDNEFVEDLTGGLTFVDPLGLPRDVIDPFGFIYANNIYMIHKGVDLRVSVGKPVLAVNGGKVILVAKKFRREGNMIIISHGAGVFSVYMHLSKFGVVVSEKNTKSKNKYKTRTLRVGDVVKRGQVIGLSGRTGAGVREPHLHFNIKFHDSYIDPLNFIDTVNKYLK